MYLDHHWVCGLHQRRRWAMCQLLCDNQIKQEDAQMVESIGLEGLYAPAEETGADKQNKVCHHDEEDEKCYAGSGTVKHFVSK
jgi:hypothetical protein